MIHNFENKTVLITGGTGSLGQRLTARLLGIKSLKKLLIYSRDEMKQWEMARSFTDPRLRFFIGDVRDKDRLTRAMSDVDYVVHAAALKIVPVAEFNPFDCIKTNVLGAMNVIDCALDQNVEKVVALSTDKASSPVNLYGASKLCSDKLFVAGNSYSGRYGTKFSVVRYGNVLCSRGSVIPYFQGLSNDELTPITDMRMTRFILSLEDGLDLIETAFESMHGGEIYVKKIPSMRVIDIAAAIRPDHKMKEIGVRPGEKLHEQMIAREDARTTFEYKGFFKILPLLNDWHQDKQRIGNGIKVSDDFEYSSDTNTDWLESNDLLLMLKQLGLH